VPPAPGGRVPSAENVSNSEKSFYDDFTQSMYMVTDF